MAVGTLMALLVFLNYYMGWVPVVGHILRAILEKPFEVSISPSDFYNPHLSGAGYGGTLGIRITNNDQNLQHLFRLGEAYISVKRPWFNWLSFFQSERLVIPTTAYGNPIRDNLTTVPLKGLGSLDFILEFREDLARGQEFGAAWKTTVVFPATGRIRRLERSFNHTPFLGD
ncbi:MAG: hypothetical protein WD939_10090 [Dehalococcoidia bacterium]